MRATADVVMRQPLLAASAIGKSFVGVRVLHDVSLDLFAGEVHALMGENGAGKSTLVRILSGVLADYDGAVLLDGAVVKFATVRDAQRAGIAIIHQELNLVPEMTVAENIFLGREPRFAGLIIDRAALLNNGRGILARLGVALDPAARVGGLRVGERQLVEIAKALSLEARILVMDEPTSALSQPECARLFQVISQIAAAGVAVVYISHRMDEVELLADRITVLRDGRLAATGTADRFTPASLIAAMVGRELDASPPSRLAGDGAVALSVRGLGLRVPGVHGGLRDAVHGVAFDVRRGEVLGIGGLLGAGRTEILETLFGSARGERTGEVFVDGHRVVIGSPREAIASGMALVTEDRKATGLLLTNSIRDNLTLPSTPRMGLFGLRRRAREAEMSRAGVARLGVRCRADTQDVGQLSGGNQQKVVLGKWLATNPRILLLDEPTRGIDVGAKQEIYDVIFQLAKAGLAIVVVTSELPELLLLSDRIVVMCEGRMTGTLSRAEADQEAVMRLASPRGSAMTAAAA